MSDETPDTTDETEDPAQPNEDGDSQIGPAPETLAAEVDPILPAPPKVKTMSIEDGKKAFSNFCKLSGYKPTDVDGYNLDRLTFTTKNGGKYKLSRNGKAFQRLLGPAAPSEA